MAKIGVIDVGGGLRGIYAAGVFDWCLENGVKFDYGIGISAGSANLASNLSGQRGRNYLFYEEYSMRRQYMGAGNMLRSGSFLNLQYIYGTLSNAGCENPLDFEKMSANPMEWYMIATDATTGKPKYFTQDANGIGHFYGHTAASAEMAEEIMARLRFEHALAQGVRAQLACFDEMFPPERAAVHRMMARYGRETMWNLLQTKLADNAAKAPDGLERAQKPWHEVLLLYNELLAENACCSLAELCIGGGELLVIGFSGRAVGRAKQRLLDEVASEKLANEHGALARRAERLYRSGWRGETDGRE